MSAVPIELAVMRPPQPQNEHPGSCAVFSLELRSDGCSPGTSLRRGRACSVNGSLRSALKSVGN